MRTITFRLAKKLDADLRRHARETGRTLSDLVRDALRRQLALKRFAGLRKSVAPFAEARGWLTDEDVFSDVS